MATAGAVEVSASPAATTPSPAIALRILVMGPSLADPPGRGPTGSTRNAPIRRRLAVARR